jgi:hypothetical protein
MKDSNGIIGNRSRDLPTCSAVPQPTALPRAPSRNNNRIYEGSNNSPNLNFEFLKLKFLQQEFVAIFDVYTFVVSQQLLKM